MNSLSFVNASRGRLAFRMIVNLLFFGGVGWQLANLGTSQTDHVPAAVVYWGDIYRQGMLEIGDRAPDFDLQTLQDAPSMVRLSDRRSNKPAVLIFGSYSCPSFRDHMADFNDVYSRFEEVADFFLIYTREAHPVEEGAIAENAGLDPISQAGRIDDRSKAAAKCATALDIQMPILLDDLDNGVAQRYRALPERVYVVNRQGKIVYGGGVSGNVNVAEAVASLQEVLCY